MYLSNSEDINKTLIVNRIIEELLLTSWNVSNNFLLCQEHSSKMYVDGYGDPTNGHGGISFIKYPLRVSR